MKEIIVNVDNYNENSIKTIEGDNLSEVYKIYICKNKRRIDLTNKIAIMAYVDEYGSKRSNILNLNITDPKEAEIELPITNIISEHNGVYACQVAIYGENNSLEQTAPFSLIVENNIFSKISNTAINSSDFHILSEAIKTTNAYEEKLKEGTENIELQYAYKLNEKLDKDGIVTMANMGQDVKEKFTGGSVAVVGKNAVLKENIVNGQVDEYKTSFLKVGKNIFDKSRVSPKGWWLNITNGEAESGVNVKNYCYSYWIPVNTGFYSFNKDIHSYCLYDINYDFIKGERASTGNPIEIPSNGRYLRVTLNYNLLDTLQIEAGETSTDFEEYYIDFSNSNASKEVARIKKELENSKEKINNISNNLNNSFALENGNYKIDKNIMEYSNILNKEALENSFTLESNFDKKYDNGEEYETYNWSSFSGWGGYIGNTSSINVIKFKIKNRGTSNTTKVKCWITENNKDGEILATIELSVDIKIGEIKEISWKFNELFNIDGKDLYLSYVTDTATTLIASDLNPQAFLKSEIGRLTYTTNIKVDELENPKSYSGVTEGSVKTISITCGTSKEVLKPTKNFNSSVNIEETQVDTVRVVLPNEFVAVVGDTLQLFYKGLIEAVNPYNYDIRVRCQKGKAFNRYYEFTPEVKDVGEYDFYINVYNNAHILLASSKCKLKVVNTTGSITNPKNILCIGDSLTVNGVWCKEAMRRLTENNGEPTGLNKNNINFIGTVRNGSCKFEGYGGWTWQHYLDAPNPNKGDMWVYCTHDKNIDDQHSIWQDANGAKWKLETIEPTRIKFTRVNGHTSPVPSSPGVLTHVENAVHESPINFTKVTVGEPNPFWNPKENRVDFKAYCKENDFDGIDYIYTLLTWNGGRADMATIEDNKIVIEQAKELIDIIHRDYPNAKIRIMGIQLPSLNGGTGASYGASGNYSYTYGLVRGVFGLNLAYQEFANREGYKDFVEFINVSGQFDSENNMPAELVRVNTRSTKTELRGTNGVHPTMEGYYQIADVAYRQLVRDLLQNQ
ncbi:BppU family phage baseplate upper protein [Clostridium perfringens]|uniref:BppU family phage baseplate upper protein n=1 Tax=Clostridium perfringens TaxID=1502 RepID=UPI0024BD3368|nr:BppU family phage baseplate upper protein [Clostridium perfringens]